MPNILQPTETVHQVLEAHLQAIQDRDLEALRATIAQDRLALVGGGGEFSESSEQFIALHQDWFRSQSWSIETELLHLHEQETFALAVLELRYMDHPSDGPGIDQRSILTLAFACREGRWELIFDQNTPKK